MESILEINITKVNIKYSPTATTGVQRAILCWNLRSLNENLDDSPSSAMNHGEMKVAIPTAHIQISSIPDHEAERNSITPQLAQPQALRRSFSKINPNANNSESNSNSTIP